MEGGEPDEELELESELDSELESEFELELELEFELDETCRSIGGSGWLMPLSGSYTVSAIRRQGLGALGVVNRTEDRCGRTRLCPPISREVVT